MSTVMYDVQSPASRNRLTSAFRLILAIPHLIAVNLWGRLVQFLAVFQWFVILFTGKRNDGIWNMQNSYLSYASRANGYAAMLHDTFPPFGPDPSSAVPSSYALDAPDSPDRLRNALRLIWVIPAAILAVLIAIGMVFVLVVSWFAILFTGRQPEGMRNFVERGVRFGLRFEAYTLLMTDTYPKFE